MKTNPFFLALLLSATVLATRANEETDLIAVLKSNAAHAEKSAACVRLRIVGAAMAVPALADLLRDEKTAHAARHALEGIPAPEAGTALQTALQQASGTLKAGLIDSLGARREIPVALIAPFLADENTAVAASAARALGTDAGEQSIAALLAQAGKGSRAVQEASLSCAERRHGESVARKIYAGLLGDEIPESIRVAAWRGMLLSDPQKQAETIFTALGSDGWQHQAALKFIYESNDPVLLEKCAANWERLPAAGQLAVLSARRNQRDGMLNLAMKASASPHPAVRTIAWQSLGDLNASAAVPALSRAAARGEPAEQAAAHEALVRIGGAEAQQAILATVASAPIDEKTELLRILGERGDRTASAVLLRHAANSHEPVRLAALDSLRRIADPDSLAPILALAAKSRTDSECEPILKALEGVCRAAPDKEKATVILLNAMNGTDDAARGRFMALLPDLGTAPALDSLMLAAASPKMEEAREAVRAMARWPNFDPAPQLLAQARTHTNAALQVLALRGSIELASHQPDLAKRIAHLNDALAAAKRPAEKTQALAALGAIPAPSSLALVESALDDPSVADEAALAAIGIAENLGNPALARKTAERLLARDTQPEVLARAWKLRGQPASGPFFQNWSVAGPFAKTGAAGAAALFDAPFAPEDPAARVEWKPAPASGGQVNLAAIFPGRENCAAYLKTRINAPEPCRAVLLLGSDDGVKAWLNGRVVHSNNVDRGDSPDQDAALIELKQGANDLMLKISQGGGGWSARARIVGLDGQPLAGLRDGH